MKVDDEDEDKDKEKRNNFCFFVKLKKLVEKVKLKNIACAFCFALSVL